MRKSPKSRRTEQSLSTEEQLALAIEALSEHVVLFDAQDRVVMANQAWRELNKDIVETTRPGTRFEDHIRAAVENGLVPEAAGHEEEWLRERLESHRNPKGPFEVSRQDGRWIRIYEQRLPNDGTILIISDVTASKRVDQALRESEERFRAVVDNSPTKIHIKDMDGRYVMINRQSELLFGVTDEEARGKVTEDIFPEHASAQFLAHDRAVAESGETIEQEEEFVLAGGVHTFLTVKFPVLDATGHINGIGAIGTDITERKRAEAELLATKVKAELDNQSKSQFLANMSHELRTPLNAIIGFSEMMATETLGPIGNDKYSDYINDINAAGQHLLGLINDILDLSKIEAGEEEMHETTLSIPDAITACEKLIRERAQKGGVTIEHQIADDIPMVRADDRKLRQILLNILSNAIKFTSSGGTLTVRAWSDVKSGCVIQIVDTGIGMSPEEIPKALTSFGQVDNAMNRRFEGTGLGLPLTKKLVEMHAGSLDLQSEKNVGTTVTVRLPKSRLLGPLEGKKSDTAA